MNLKIAIIIIVLLVISGISIYLLGGNNKKNNNNNNSDINNNINNNNDDDKKGKVELVYKINAGIPFKWVYEIEDESIVKFEESYQIRNDNNDGRSGGAIETKYVFKGIKEGTTTITFKYISIDSKEVYEVYKHVVKVDAYNNATIIENN